MPATWLRAKGRWKAAFIHLLVTITVACLSGLLVFGVWYPYPYRIISGGLELFVLLVSADVIVGPLLTAVVFSASKSARQLRLDISVIALVQVAFLLYGLHTVFAARPVYLVYEVDRFKVISAADIDDKDLSLAPPAYRQLPLFGPKKIGTRRSKPGPEQLRSVLLAMEGKDLGQRPEFYQDFELSRSEAVSRSRPIDSLTAKYPDRLAEISAALASAGKSPKDLRYIPLVARLQWVAIVDASSADILAYAPFDGF
ncbi:pilus assembly protein [Rhizobacter sp. AJA081-3]|uniref:TfpX/TfpZ family type IV pilin accessory protein n=1 Tax=Rhizobacter sp. AJA081-3 TaxID=2753607 RepID=UPI001ADF3AA6|nr:TfpX/TfpZ family type IV pilin accessory protein [Rhizobacter sp. AJA081-3]QTN22901.1 pilus assembly protein [Rhizobacter sp. AJA081-3]